MGNPRSGHSSTSGKAPGSAAGKKGKPASKNTSSTRKRASTDNQDDNQENSGITAEQWALDKNIRTQLAGKKKAEIAAEDEGMSSIFILAACLGS